MATVSVTGPWSALNNTNATSQGPGAVTNESLSQMDQTVESRGASLGLTGRQAFTDNVDGFQEVTQFAGLMADAYNIGSRAALVRIGAIVQTLLGTETVETQRVYQP